MNSDPTRKVRPRERTRLRAETWNEMQEASRWVRERSRRTGAEVPDDPMRVVVKVRNVSGGDVAQFGVLKLATPVVTPADNLTQFKNVINFDGDTPGATTDRFCVLMEPLSDDWIGDAVVSGAVPVQIQMTDLAHTLATPKVGNSNQLISSATSGVPILYNQGLGTAWGYVLLGPPAAASGGAITVKESDNTPTISGVTSVAFDSEGSGTWETGPGAFLVSGSSPNAAVTSRLRLASASASGIVQGPGGARQHFGGDYAFDLSVDFVGDTTFGAIMAINGTVDYGDSVPAHNGSGGHNGQFACDGTYLYFKDSNFGWGRVALNFSF